jgi:ribosome-associated protein
VSWSVPEREISFRFTPSGGPGGQHANRSNTRVEATFDVVSSAHMPESLRRRVIDRLGPVVRVVVDEERSQHRNREIAVARLRERVVEAGREPKRRRPTRPSLASRRRRLEAKRRRGEIKRGRGRLSSEE